MDNFQRDTTGTTICKKKKTIHNDKLQKKVNQINDLQKKIVQNDNLPKSCLE